MSLYLRGYSSLKRFYILKRNVAISADEFQKTSEILFLLFTRKNVTEKENNAFLFANITFIDL